ncbi:serine/threonine-protein kinase [Marinimicrobium sp. ABcell2]|uniref:serine/threonine-protein kinase n=1 Tax=Marinimicrobium sp. ABcell2 TaxID=3069751 RepID=UPI0027B4CC99|nr:serine/threonine-protein kinase [Marinimicrobium sp. ABcell2]MDQ2077919.1 serine/threonine-protein kinase [Marinimicrobium sp. ABcell2]
MEIPGYNIVDTLGEGRSATVYLAFVENADREVALKVFSAQVSADKAFGEQFARQASLLSELEHPSIASVYEQGSHGGRFYLAMEYVPGRNLRHKRFELDLPEQLSILEEVARALDAANLQGCVHGNLKPENIILHAEDSRPMVLDFGMGWSAGTDADWNTYLSPEQREGGALDERSDVYSLGRVLLLLLHDLLPHPPMRPGESPQLRPELEFFQPLIDRTLAPNPEDRYGSCAEFAHALSTITLTQLQAVMSACEEALMREGEEDRSKSASREEQSAGEQVPGETPDQTQAQEEVPPFDLDMPEAEGQKLDVAEVDELNVAEPGLAAQPEDRIEPEGGQASRLGTVLPWALALVVVMGTLLIMLLPGCT